MPFFASIESTAGYGRAVQPAAQPQPSGDVPSYYTSSSGYLMSQQGFSVTTMLLQTIANIANTTAIRTYTGFTAAWTFIHDKDLDSNVWYGMAESGTPKSLRQYVLTKGGTTVTATTIYSYSGATTSVLGACYAPLCMWTGTSYGAFVIAGFSQAVIHVLEFNSTKTGIANTYTVAYTSEVYGTEMIPKQASGFNNHYGVAYTRGTRQMSSWTVNMDTRTWSNRFDNSYSAGTTGPSNGDGMIYYPIGKPILSGDPDTSTNRIAMNDTSTARLYVWTITESGTRIIWTYLKQVTTAANGTYPYHMSQNTYDSVS
jgi:hypothetical protein